MEKQKINVHFSANLRDRRIEEFLSKDFEITIINITKEDFKSEKTNLNNKIKTIDLIIFTGGEDVDPAFYNENIGKFTNINKKRDSLEFNLLYLSRISSSILYNIPKLGICKGAQLLTVYNGGKLIQHVTGHTNNNQIIEYLKDSDYIETMEVSSDHHQMMFPYDLSEKNYELIGWSKLFQSNTYLNGENKEITLPLNFLEPEIVYYPHRNSLCIQSHPEWCIGTEGSNICLELIKKYLFNNKLKEKLVIDKLDSSTHNNNTNLSQVYKTFSEINNESLNLSNSKFKGNKEINYNGSEAYKNETTSEKLIRIQNEIKKHELKESQTIEF